MQQIDVSIIIVNYNTYRLLRDCLFSIIEHTQRCSYEIIIVDNASQDNSYEIVSEFPNIKWIQSYINIGFGNANNLGVSNATGKYVFFLNSDTILLNDAISILFDFFEQSNHNGGLGAIGTYLLDENHNNNLSFSSFPSVCFEWGYLINKIKKNTSESLKTTKEVDVISGADLFMSRATFQNIGGFDPNFFMYYEETDLQLRLKNKGERRMLVKGPQIIHLEGGSFNHSGLSYSRFCMAQKSYNYYISKNFKRFEWLWYRFNIVILRLSVFLSKWTFKQKIKAYKIVIFNNK